MYSYNRVCSLRNADTLTFNTLIWYANNRLLPLPHPSSNPHILCLALASFTLFHVFYNNVPWAFCVLYVCVHSSSWLLKWKLNTMICKVGLFIWFSISMFIFFARNVCMMCMSCLLLWLSSFNCSIKTVSSEYCVPCCKSQFGRNSKFVTPWHTAFVRSSVIQLLVYGSACDCSFMFKIPDFHFGLLPLELSYNSMRFDSSYIVNFRENML